MNSAASRMLVSSGNRIQNLSVIPASSEFGNFKGDIKQQVRLPLQLSGVRNIGLDTVSENFK
jgi:hypothetical protein